MPDDGPLIVDGPRPRPPTRAARFVAVLMPDPPALATDDRYYGPMLRGLSDRLLAGGLCIRPIQTRFDYQQGAFLERRTREFAGVAFVGLYQVDAFVGEVARRYRDVPRVALDHHYEGLAIHSVREDAGEGMRRIVDHLAGLGHEHFAYMDNHRPEMNPWKRDGLRAGLEAHSLELPKGYVAGCRYTRPRDAPAEVHRTDVYAALEWFLSLDPRPTAIVCCDDVRALLAVEAAEALGLAVPRDLSVTGFGDVAFRDGESRFLTSLHLDPALMGERAAELLFGPADARPEAALVPLTPVVRRSTGPAPAAPKEEKKEG